jgi:GT2 family glycosyltransferase
MTFQGLAAPASVAEIELAEPVTVTHMSVADAGEDGEAARQALVLVRLHAQPLATIVVDARGGIVDSASCASAAWAALAPALGVHLAQDGITAGSPVLAEPDGRPPRCREAVAVPMPAPPVTVIVATRERAASLAACLDALAQLDYADYEVVVVDNAPVTDQTARLVSDAYPWVRYAQENQRGLAAAHNCGLRVAQGAILAFTDDDVLVDRCWLTEVVKGFQADTGVACVTGLIMPAELQTPAQVALESHGHFSKGFQQRVFDLGSHRPDDPLFPFTAGRLGSGANMSFDRDALRDIGGFDAAIGTGTVARGGDDLAAFFAVIAAGHRLVYQPAALVWHRHKRDLESLANQAYGYGVGLGAYLTSALANHPATIGKALYRAPAGLAYAFRSDSPRNAHLQGTWPNELVWIERRGLAFGPIAYGISRWRTRVTRRSAATRALAD